MGAIEGGRLDLAEFLLRDEAQVALAGVIHPQGSHLALAIERSPRPDLAIELLCSYGAQPHTLNRDGSSALHATCELPPERGVAAAKILIALGLSPRLKNDDHRTPIGNAMNRWSWSQIRDALGASPFDVATSINYQPTDSLAFSSLLAAIDNTSSSPDSDSRLCELAHVAHSAPGGLGVAVSVACATSCARDGKLDTFAELLPGVTAHGAPLSPSLLLTAFKMPPAPPVIEEARRACARKAHALGMDMNQIIRWPGLEYSSPTTLMLATILAFDNHYYHKDDSDSDFFHAALLIEKRIDLLIELGANASCPNSSGTPLWKGEEWAHLSPITQAKVLSNFAKQEAREILNHEPVLANKTVDATKMRSRL